VERGGETKGKKRDRGEIGNEEGNERWMERIRRLERRMEGERKKNIIIKGLNIRKGEIEEKIKEIMGRIEVGMKRR